MVLITFFQKVSTVPGFQWFFDPRWQKCSTVQGFWPQMTESDDSSWFSMVFCSQMTEMIDSTRFLTPDDRKWRQYLVFNGFVDFWSQGRNTSNRVFWSPFCRLLEPRPENAQIDPSGAHFVDFWSQGRNASNRAFWSSFCRLLEPRPENAQIDPSGAHFVDFWRQGRKMLKSSLLCNEL